MKNIAWAICGKIFSLLSILVVGIIVARYLGKEQYGIISLMFGVPKSDIEDIEKIIEDIEEIIENNIEEYIKLYQEDYED